LFCQTIGINRISLTDHGIVLPGAIEKFNAALFFIVAHELGLLINSVVPLFC
jgi:hypothetical protein